MVKFAIAALLTVAATAHTACGGDVQLLDFSSPFCGPCQQMVPPIQSLETAGYPVRRVDTTREPNVAQQYHVTQIPCFIMLVDGRETERLVGATSQNQLVEMFQRATRLRTQSPDAQLQPAAPQPTSPAAPAGHPASGSAGGSPRGDDPWSGVSAASAPARPVTHTETLSPRQPLHDPLASKLINSSVRLRVDDSTGRSYGTGTIIDSRSGEALRDHLRPSIPRLAGQGPDYGRVVRGDGNRLPSRGGASR